VRKVLAAAAAGGHWAVPLQPRRVGQVQRSARTFMWLGRELWRQRRVKATLVTTAVSVTGLLSLWGMVLLMNTVMQAPGML
jgi:hypothetical protein